MLHVSVFSQEIKGSPFTIDLLAPSKQKLPEVEYIESVTVDLLMSGPGVLSACVIGMQSGNVPVAIDLLKEQRKATISFNDKTKDIYTLYVYWNSRLVRGAPFKVDLSVY